MAITKLDHVNIRTARLGEMMAWYTDVLGLERGKRPDFPDKGAWMYAGDAPVVHLVEIYEPDAVGSEANLKLEHFALSGTGGDEFMAKLDGMGVAYKRVDVESINMFQINVHDPDGNHIHIDFGT